MYCPNCDQFVELESKEETRIYRFKNTDVSILDKFYQCPNCNVEWSLEGFDFAASVYQEYEKLNKETD